MKQVVTGDELLTISYCTLCNQPISEAPRHTPLNN